MNWKDLLRIVCEGCWREIQVMEWFYSPNLIWNGKELRGNGHYWQSYCAQRLLEGGY